MTLCWSLGGRGGSWLGLGSMIKFLYVGMCSLNVNKLKFQVWKKSDMFELSYDEICWIKICWHLGSDRIGSDRGDRGDRGEDEFKDQPRLIKCCNSATPDLSRLQHVLPWGLWLKDKCWPQIIPLACTSTEGSRTTSLRTLSFSEIQWLLMGRGLLIQENGPFYFYR